MDRFPEPAAQNGGYLRCAPARANYRASEEDRLRRPGACVRRWSAVSRPGERFWSADSPKRRLA